MPRRLSSATGDGDVGALAGCAFEIGVADACPCQPLSMDALLVVKDAAKLTRFIHGSGSSVSKQSMNDSKKALLAEIQRGGFDPSYQGPTIFPIRDNLLLAMMNHAITGSTRPTPRRSRAATIRARAELHRIVKALRSAATGRESRSWPPGADRHPRRPPHQGDDIR
jgi:hypothetical protein